MLAIRPDRREGGFLGVLDRAGIPKTTDYRLIELFQRYPEVSHLGHFGSVAEALQLPQEDATEPAQEPAPDAGA